MKKIISILITCILCFFMIGCENVNYNATFYDNAKKKAYEIISIAIPVIILILSTLSLVGDSYNPFLYFQF